MNSQSRSLLAAPEMVPMINRAMTAKALNHQNLADKAGCSRATAINFCTGKNIDRKNFVKFCEVLGLDWEAISGLKLPQTQIAPEPPQDIDELVTQMRNRVQEEIQKRCGTMRVLDMTQPIGVDTIYTDVNILEKAVGKSRAEIAQLMQNYDAKNFDRFFLGTVRQKRVNGLEAVNRKKLLMILGRPGSGKTTFLKRLAMMSISGEHMGDRVPLFVTLKEFADGGGRDLLGFITRSLNGSDLFKVEQVLKVGKALVLLDGLDEVQEAVHDRVSNEIRNFGRRYNQNHIVITCRIAAKEYIFEQFTEVEMADFNDGQIKTFATKWFVQSDPKIGELFIAALQQNEPVKELATNPLLLTLLCLEFEEASAFPSSRAELYERGLNILLTKWDGQRRIHRDIVYKQLSRKRKESLFSPFAYSNLSL